MKTLIRAAENKQKGRMRPAGRQFDMPDVNQNKWSFKATLCPVLNYH